MGRILAIDFGKKRSGIAVSDELKIIASGLTTVFTNKLLEFLKKYTTDEKVDLFIIGKPKRLNNTDSEIEVLITEFLKKLSDKIPDIPIKRIDERFSSKIAFKTMIDIGVSKKKRQNKFLIDKISATVILQSYLYYK
ncbi:MAG: Holliday junction resolvase RuvX [Tenacibaculum sp.]